MKIKLVTGFRRDQEYSIDANEAHKAYYLFLNPEARSIFNNGLAIKGDQIQEIVPDYQGTMGWNPTHVLDTDDWNELRDKGITAKMQATLAAGKELAQHATPAELNIPLSELVKKYPQLNQPQEKRQSGYKRIGEMLP
jgi:hypothetical protein